LYKKYLPQQNLPFYWKPFHCAAGYCSTSNHWLPDDRIFGQINPKQAPKIFLA
jgi:hypothetical protein